MEDLSLSAEALSPALSDVPEALIAVLGILSVMPIRSVRQTPGLSMEMFSEERMDECAI